jgi:LPS-assembly protein
MTRYRAFPSSQRLLRVLTAAVAAASVPTFALAQGSAKSEKTDEKNAPATVSAERMSGRPDRELILERDVEVTRGATTINADNATYRIMEDEVEAAGNVRMRRFGDTYTGDELKLRIEEGKGYVTNPSYRLERNNAQGGAERIDFESQDRARVTDGTYSTCEGPDPDWYLKSNTLNLDFGRDVGTAAKTVVYFKGVPILATPAMSFPLSDARKSGVLPPTIGTSSNGGLDITVPYYFNIAPNRDLTLFPRIIARRGLQLGAEGRYLSEAYSGRTRFEYLPNDMQTKTDRYSLATTHTQTLAPGLSFGWNINSASDDNYPNDFSRSITDVSQRLLLRDVNLNYGGNYWNATARVSNYQVLQDPLAPIARPYDRLPQLTLHSRRQDVQGFDWTGDAEMTRFWHPDLVRGDRFVANTSIAYPMLHPGYFVTPKLLLNASKYLLDNQLPGVPNELNRVVPTLSVDSGMVFERDARFFGQSMTQTLEPRLFYVNTPFREQSAIPLFDTAAADLSFAQFFSENRFVGNDRISDANQLTAALVSRYIEPAGAERLRLAIGQRYYFTPQRVTLPGTTVNDIRSDLLLSASGRLTPTVTVDGNLQYNQSLGSTPRANYGVRWQPAPKKVLNLIYRRDLLTDPLNPLKQVDVSAQWPLANRWYGVGRINYSLPDKKVAEGLLGVEYKADCWVFRLVGQRIPTATAVATSTIFFQLELNGLTRLGSNPLEALRTSIPGYQLVNPRNP